MGIAPGRFRVPRQSLLPSPVPDAAPAQTQTDRQRQRQRPGARLNRPLGAEAKEAEPTRRLEDFLKDIDAELTINPIRAALEARAFELINKTNQFNLNGKRLTEPEFRAVLQDTQRIALVVSYKDKFGPLGNIAVLLGRLCFPVLSIDTWVMSCRAFGRQIEHKCLEYLFEVFGVSEIDLDYRQTARNELVREFLRQFMDEEPTSKWTIGRDVFQNRKPKLSHRTNNVTYV